MLWGDNTRTLLEPRISLETLLCLCNLWWLRRTQSRANMHFTWWAVVFQAELLSVRILLFQLTFSLIRTIQPLKVHLVWAQGPIESIFQEQCVSQLFRYKFRLKLKKLFSSFQWFLWRCSFQVFEQRFNFHLSWCNVLTTQRLVEFFISGCPEENLLIENFRAVQSFHLNAASMLWMKSWVCLPQHQGPHQTAPIFMFN